MAAGTLRTLVVMNDKRLPGLFDSVPTLKEKGIDLSIVAWRGLAAPKGTPKPIIDRVAAVAKQVSEDKEFQESLSKANLGGAYADGAGFRKRIDADNAFFADLAARLKLAD